MTETDLFTAEGSAEQDTLSTPESTPETPSHSAAEVSSPTTAEAGAASDASLSAMVLPELRALANRVGVKGTSGMRKSELIAAIRDVNGNGGNSVNGGEAAQAAESPESAPSAEPSAQAPANGAEPAGADNQAEGQVEGQTEGGAPRRRERRGASRESGAPAANGAEQANDQPANDQPKGDKSDQAKNDKNDQTKNDKNDQTKNDKNDQAKNDKNDKNDQAKNDKNDQARSDDQGGDQNRGGADDDGDGRGGRRGRRFRDRRRRGERGGEGGGEAELREDDVVQPVAGILDVLDNYAFVRTSGYLAGPGDVYVSMNMVRKNGLRRGDAVTGAVRVPREGDSGDKNPRQKFNPLVRLDSVNGGPVEDARNRPDFTKLTPLYPNQRLRLETTGEKLTTRVIDLIMPIGKGQRALIVSPPKAGKTTIMQDIANAITRNNPECHLMVVLVDERPEEVTDMQRSVKGEVIASTFDRPPSDHTQAAELAIERAKRLVEQGKDVVVLLDSITRLGRAYNNASPASGRILSGGVDSTALYPPKRFLGAARNIEDGGSLTIIATAMVETGSTGDTVIFEEFKGTGNAELKLDRKIAERRVFPAVDVNPSGTRKDELLLSPDEFAIVHKLRRLLSGLDSHQAIDLLMSQLRKTKNNYEFLVQVSKTTPGMDND
ncbi:transcription termination factor Rho [[Mycobacterium] zoologicum]|uniref:transcription termination factor Rho n=1 Tax=[Mycobacterium] zoologicum TaxID=2872311 RepID=UPI001CDB1179|nr:transcription termination factor Rho [Mycolicibacter sp. MYC101]MEB3065623.1 transcription termination factor Rho [Mycolicibacter sp. MYC101]